MLYIIPNLFCNRLMDNFCSSIVQSKLQKLSTFWVFYLPVVDT